MESYAILSWIKYLWENIGLERCTKKGFTLALGLRVVVLLVVVLVLPLRLRFYRNANKHKEQINNKKTSNAMHTHVDMSI